MLLLLYLLHFTRCSVTFVDTGAALVLADQLDGIRKRLTSESSPQHMLDYLQLPDDYETRNSAPGKKRVSLLC